MKDNFSSQSDNYAKYRPTYPLEFFDFLNSLLPSKMNATITAAASKYTCA